ncbi:MAG: Coq4 family protein [Pseudomonadota bacterium]
MDINENPLGYRFNPLIAVDAIRNLIRNKEDTAQVFRLLVALRGNTFARNFKRFEASPVGARVLANKEDLVDVLSDRAYLESLPKGSLSHALITFFDSCGISPQGLNDAAHEAGLNDQHFPEDLVRYAGRLRVQHDLWHVIGGYGCDGFGEVCNLAFSYPHSKNIGMMVLAIVGAHNYAKAFPGEPIRSAMWEGYQRGKRLIWLIGVDWEKLLPLPLEDVRKTLGVTDTPKRYMAAPRVIAASGTMAPIAA